MDGEEGDDEGSRPPPPVVVPRTTAAARLNQTLEERRAWVSSTASNSAGLSPTGSQGQEPSVNRLPLREVVQRCLDDWGIQSDSSEDDDDFCGWRVGSRALPLPGEPWPLPGAGLPPPPARRPSLGSGGSGRPPGRLKSCLLQ